MSKHGWVGVDLDGTLAYYDHWRGETHIGEPIEPMLNRVKEMLSNGVEVRIFTARVAAGFNKDGSHRDISGFLDALDEWCLKHVGQTLPVTNVKDWEMVTLFDDRAIRVEKNTGRIVG